MVNLPAGNEPITLTGKPQFNPAAGNPFRFEGITDSETLANRKKGMGWAIVLAIGASLIGVFIGKAIAQAILG